MTNKSALELRALANEFNNARVDRVTDAEIDGLVAQACALAAEQAAVGRFAVRFDLTTFRRPHTVAPIPEGGIPQFEARMHALGYRVIYSRIGTCTCAGRCRFAWPDHHGYLLSWNE